MEGRAGDRPAQERWKSQRAKRVDKNVNAIRMRMSQINWRVGHSLEIAEHKWPVGSEQYNRYAGIAEKWPEGTPAPRRGMSTVEQGPLTSAWSFASDRLRNERGGAQARTTAIVAKIPFPRPYLLLLDARCFSESPILHIHRKKELFGR
jgi:hypothetical protein